MCAFLYGCLPVCVCVCVSACCIMYIDVCDVHGSCALCVHICGHYMYTVHVSLGALQCILHWEYYTIVAMCVSREIENGVLCIRRCGSSLPMFI